MGRETLPLYKAAHHDGTVRVRLARSGTAGAVTLRYFSID
jgi:hypothetical protein